MVGCSGKEREVHMEGEFHNATVSIINSTTSLELKLPAPYVFIPSHAITLELNLPQPRKWYIVCLLMLKYLVLPNQQH